MLPAENDVVGWHRNMVSPGCCFADVWTGSSIVGLCFSFVRKYPLRVSPWNKSTSGISTLILLRATNFWWRTIGRAIKYVYLVSSYQMLIQCQLMLTETFQGFHGAHTQQGDWIQFKLSTFFFNFGLERWPDFYIKCVMAIRVTSVLFRSFSSQGRTTATRQYFSDLICVQIV